MIFFLFIVKSVKPAFGNLVQCFKTFGHDELPIPTIVCMYVNQQCTKDKKQNKITCTCVNVNFSRSKRDNIQEISPKIVNGNIPGDETPKF